MDICCYMSKGLYDQSWEGGLLLNNEYIKSDQMQQHLEIGTLLKLVYNEGNLSSQELLLHSDNRVEKKKYKLNPRTWEQKSGGPRVQGYSWFGIT